MKKVLLALDGSDQSFDTVRYVSQMMPPTETQVDLFHVFSKVPDSYWDLENESVMDVWMAKVQAFEQEHRDTVERVMSESRDILLKSEFREDKVLVNIRERKAGIARDIVKEGQKGYDTLFLGRVGQTNLKNVPMGSVTNKVISSLTGVNTCVVTGTPEIDKILIAFDGSEGALSAVDLACTLLRGQEKEVILFNAIRRLSYSFIGQDDKNNNIQQLEEVLFEEEKSFLDPMMEGARKSLIKAGINRENIKCKIVTRVQSRAAALLEESKASGCGSIFVGRRGLTQDEGFHIGRVTNKVVNKARDMAVWIVSRSC